MRNIHPGGNRRWFAGLLAVLLVFSGCGKNAETPDRPSDDHIVTFQTENTQEDTTSMETVSVMLLYPTDEDFVRVRDYIPDIQEELKYADADNFTGTVIYNFRDTYLRYGTIKKLMAVQEELRAMGLGLKIWDGFRPSSAQFKLWDILPDDTYVANPNEGFSNHSRGNAVDLTIVDAQGTELKMPTGFDDFSGRADRNYQEIPEIEKNNSLLLEQVMEKHGFKGYYGEWWHYNDTQRYEPEWVFDPGLITLWVVIGEGKATLAEPGEPEHILAEMDSGTVVTLMGYDGDRALISWQSQRGYMDCTRLFPYKS